HFAERFAQSAAWNVKAPLHFPTQERILDAFQRAEFSWTVKPLWGRTPFNNHLFVFRRHAAATGLAWEAHSGNLHSLGDEACSRGSADGNPGCATGGDPHAGG